MSIASTSLSMQLPEDLLTCQGNLEIVEDRAQSAYFRQSGVKEASLPSLRLMRRAHDLPCQRKTPSRRPIKSMPQHDRWSNELKTGGTPKMPLRNYAKCTTENDHKMVLALRSEPPPDSILDEALRIVNVHSLNSSKYRCVSIQEI